MIKLDVFCIFKYIIFLSSIFQVSSFQRKLHQVSGEVLSEVHFSRGAGAVMDIGFKIYNFTKFAFLIIMSYGYRLIHIL